MNNFKILRNSGGNKMDIIEVYDLIAPSRDNLIKIAKAVRTDFDSMLGYYITFERLSIRQALIKVSGDIVETYKDKEDLWNEVKKQLETV